MIQKTPLTGRQSPALQDKCRKAWGTSMTDLKQYKRERKKMKREIKATRLHLARLKSELEQLRLGQQHRVIDQDMGSLLEESSQRSPSLIKRAVQFLRG